ncbi:aminotransferase class IV [Agaribacter marinus]|uniref:Aminodeoxychorismate lyase n=1 Tax=Agaribacter marinus TaxID=1431249 RepID=A0AA37WHH1_9ALTE|nr:aminotransferase class IV [Agaribacter marinus]GLR69857.1 cytochrome c550 [Agaribacter marinus]
MTDQLVYLNGNFVPKTEATISPMDRGFLFGDGIYEVIPCYEGKPVGLALHLARMRQGLAALDINYSLNINEWSSNIDALIAPFDGDASVYLHVSRGTDNKRYHAYPSNIQPTVFAYAFPIAPSQPLDKDEAKVFKVKTQEDLRWKRCHIKSTSLLGNVMHFQQGQDSGVDEVLLYNQQNELTEAAACNLYVVKNNVVATPPLDNQILPGITRHILLHAMRDSGVLEVQERVIKKDELTVADEVWISSSSKEVAAVVEVDGKLIGDGRPGDAWLVAQSIYNDYKFKM